MNRPLIFFFNLFFYCAVSFAPLEAQSLKRLTKTPSKDIPSGTVPIPEDQGLNILIKRDAFVDITGRTMFLRGINLSGSTKVPYSPNLGTHIKEGFFNGKEVSFVGRPFPLEEANEHFRRLKAWGFHFLRFLVTWEAIEHEGPGIYDTEYLQYVKDIITKAGEYGINVMIDPHQDVWSRFTGGDGAPLWTFEVVGMDVSRFQETGSAIVHNTYGDPFPKMIWYTNYYKLGAATMFTLFFGGNDFAPLLKIDGNTIQDYLQQHYIDALFELAKVVKDLPNVVGFELMNEPSSGFIGIEDIGAPYYTDIIGDAPTPYQSMALGNGIPQQIQNNRLGVVALKKNGNPIINPDSACAWKGGVGIWRQHSVWGLSGSGSPQLLKKDYFAHVNGKSIDFNQRYYEPFAIKYAEKILSVNPNWFICVDNVLNPYPLKLPDLKKYSVIKWVNGSHWYDDVTLVKKKYMPFLGLKDGEIVFGKKNVKEAFVATLAEMIEETQLHYGDAPSLLGEFGIPFDMNNAKAYKTANFNKQTKALNRSFQVAEENLLNYTIWNYTPDNTNQRGDQWNGEDLSVYSLSQQNLYPGINAGGRALEAAIRPYPKKIAGTLLKYHYEYESKTLTIDFENQAPGKYPTEIFLPEFIYGNGFVVYSDISHLAFDKEEGMLLLYPETSGKHKAIIKLD